MKRVKIILTILFPAILIALPHIGFAASLYFSVSSKEFNTEDIFVAQVKLSSPNENINVAEGILTFNKNILDVKGISTGDSIFSLWTRAPVFSNENGMIMFTGGTPEGFKGKEGEILKIVFVAKAKGKANLAFAKDSALYLSDGKGTKIQSQMEPAVISVLARPSDKAPKDEWSGVLAGDKSPPNGLEVKLGNDPSLFGGKYFISFFATDDGSGIKSYEVKEGDGDFVESESPYVLKDQNLKSQIQIRAADKAGNYSIAKFSPRLARMEIYLNLLIMLAIIMVFVAIGIVYSKLKKKHARR